MPTWNYNPNDYKENNYAIVPVGDHRVRIEKIEEKTSSSGNNMLELTLAVSGFDSSLWYYLVFLTDNPALTNQRIGEISKSFGVTTDVSKYSTWLGKVGAARVKHDEYGAKVKYFLSPEKAKDLPPWQGKEYVATAPSTTASGVAPIPDDELPF